MKDAFRALTAVFGFLGSLGSLIFTGFWAVVWVITSAHNENVDSVMMGREVLELYLAITLGAFSGSIVSYSRPKLGGTLLILSGGSALAMEVPTFGFAILTNITIYTVFLAGLIFGWGILLLIAGLLAIIKRSSWPHPSNGSGPKRSEAGSSRLPALSVALRRTVLMSP